MDIEKMKFYRKHGMIPNRYWYQLNGQSAVENWTEQRKTMYERIQDQKQSGQAEEIIPQIILTSEVTGK